MVSILSPHEPGPVLVERADGASPALLSCEHAGRRLPASLGDLGLPESERGRHIAWDIGAYGVAQRMAAALDATLVSQVYSRLVVDCNRRTASPTFIPTLSEATTIPGNLHLTDADIAARRAAIWQPFQDRMAAMVSARLAAGRPTALFAIHSFTPVFLGEARPWHITFLHGADPRPAQMLDAAMRREPGIVSALNEPYVVNEWDYTIPVHGDDRGVPAVLIEIRQDLIADEAGQAEWAARLGPAIAACADALVRPGGIRVAGSPAGSAR